MQERYIGDVPQEKHRRRYIMYRTQGDAGAIHRRCTAGEAPQAIHQRCTAIADRLGTAHCREIHEACIR